MSVRRWASTVSADEILARSRQFGEDVGNGGDADARPGGHGHHAVGVHDERLGDVLAEEAGRGTERQTQEEIATGTGPIRALFYQSSI